MTTTADSASSVPPLLPVELACCDRCRASAGFYYWLPDGLDLVFCGHHSRRYGLALLAAGARPAEIPG